MTHKQEHYDNNHKYYIYTYQCPNSINGSNKAEIFYVCGKCHDSGCFTIKYQTLADCQAHLATNHANDFF